MNKLLFFLRLLISKDYLQLVRQKCEKANVIFWQFYYVQVVPVKTLAAERSGWATVLLERHLDLVRAKVGLVTNHTGVNGEGKV